MVAAPSFAYTPQDRERERSQEQERGKNERDTHHEYHFKQENKRVLQQHYPDRGHVDYNRREHFVAGQRLSGDWRARVRPVPETVIRELPPIPAGLEVGYIDGYAMVYDPNTGEIVEVLDLQ
jgi:Ni/Co efflux regulator RcnB